MGCDPSAFTGPVPLFPWDVQRGGVAYLGPRAAMRAQRPTQQAPRLEEHRSGLNGALHSHWAGAGADQV